MPILNTVESLHLWGVISPILIPMGLTFVLALVLFYIAMRMTPGKKQRTFSIFTLFIIPVSLIVFLYISLSTR